MKIQIISDLHVDVRGAAPIPELAQGAELVLIAGDTCQGLAKAVELHRRAFPRTEIAMVAGNHEFYGHALGEELQAGRDRARALGIHLLENDVAKFGGLTVIGATLWTDFALFGETVRVSAMRNAADKMRDHKKIKWQKKPWMRFRPEEALAMHRKSRGFIEAKLTNSRSEGTTALVLTHHAASIEAVEPKLQRSITSAAYASELLPLIDRHQPAWWISGHTHYAMNHLRGRCRMVSNPRGYPDEQTGFDERRTIDVVAC